MDALYSEIIILGGVPIAVFIPPKMHAKDSGIRNLAGCHSRRWQIFKVIGRRIAKAPILFINDDKNAAIKRSETRN